METPSFENSPPAAIHDALGNNINTEASDQETNQPSIETRDTLGRENGAQTEIGENSAKNTEHGVSAANLSNASTNTALDDDVIPNAIVIKNIPFAIKKEQLLDIIEDMDLPLPYAFNYHFDNGIFRGLAFANFTTPEETTQVITSLNGKEISGRKLKVEYKKMLPQAERERIEREKREKRGQLEEQHRSSSNLSLHSLSKMGASGNNNTSNNQLFSTLMNGINANSMINSPMNNTINNSSSNSNTGGNINLNQPSLSAQHTSSSLYQAINANNQNQMSTERFYAPLPSTSTLPLPPQQLDFNDPDTLEIYSQLLLFKDREKYYYELAYPIGISASHKRIINVLCSYLGLVEVYDPRFIIIRRKILDHANLQSHLQQQGQMTSAHPLQPNSTGGSMNRSQSYTSLLQAHAAAAANSISNQAVNNSSNSNSIGNGNGNGNNNVIVNNNSASSTPKISSQGQFSMQPTLTSPKMNIHHNSQYNSADQPQQPQPQSQQNVQSAAQQQQSFLRQQATLTPSSRIPSGYSANHYQINSVNPLLRNSQISPPNSQIPINSQSLSQAQPPSQSQTQQRVPVAYQNASLSSQQLYNLNGPSSTANSQSQLLPQHTNGSVHSNFSYQSYHDESMLSVHNLNSADLIYKSLSHSGLDDGLEQGLNRSLSGLDLQNQNKKNLW
ncbi:Pin4p [Saccharomyces paradoxus]|uniref:Pin4p n=1 Tax=Saccharomyces paradoxus TaxID=27291 RepID=A0A8B8ULB5_SACPA|nr:Pin4 [Saccharomyces paradoxus]QHS71516.1 Pin4 [Saccharomyces paradoxus]